MFWPRREGANLLKSRVKWNRKYFQKYNNFIKLEINYLEYELIYQLYYALCNVALWDKSYVEETKKILIKLKI